MRTIVLLTAMLAFATIASAGTVDNPEITDPAADVTITSAPLTCPAICPAHNYEHADILKVWLEEQGPPMAATHVLVHVMTNATISSPLTATYAVFTEAAPANLTVQFNVNPGPISYASSTANGTQYSIRTAGGATPTGIPNATVAVVGNIATFSIPLAEIGAVGGDQLGSIQAFTQSDCACTAGDTYTESGLDSASNATAVFEISRPPIVNSMNVVYLGGNLTDEGTSTSFTGTSVSMKDGNGSVMFNFRVTNTGTDADTFRLTPQISSLNQAAGASSPVSLAAGASADMGMTLQLSNELPGAYNVSANFASVRGASSSVSFGLTLLEPDDETPIGGGPDPVDPTPGTGGTTNGTTSNPVLGGIPFLSDLADDLGFRDMFGDWAEVVLVAAAVLLLLLLILLIFFLARRTWITIHLDPTKQAARPGEYAEFLLTIRNRKKTMRDLHVRFTQTNKWSTGLLLETGDGTVHEPMMDANSDMAVTLSSKKSDGVIEGMLRVRVPKDAEAKSRNRIEVTGAPVDINTKKEFKKKAKTTSCRVGVDTSPVPVAPVETGFSPEEIPSGIHLVKVRHEPEDPVAGADMTTTAIIEHDGFDPMRVSVECFVNGNSVGQETFRLQPAEARAVVFPWTCPDGPADVKVEVDQE